MLRATVLAMKYFDLLAELSSFDDFFADLMQIYQVNPLLAGLVLMRNVSYQGQKFPDSVYGQNFRNIYTNKKK